MRSVTGQFEVTDEQRAAFEDGLCALPFIAASRPMCFERRVDGDYASPFVNGAFYQYCLQELKDGHLEEPGAH